jgi:hypothetical protein
MDETIQSISPMTGTASILSGASQSAYDGWPFFSYRF